MSFRLDFLLETIRLDEGRPPVSMDRLSADVIAAVQASGVEYAPARVERSRFATYNAGGYEGEAAYYGDPTWPDDVKNGATAFGKMRNALDAVMSRYGAKVKPGYGHGPTQWVLPGKRGAVVWYGEQWSPRKLSGTLSILWPQA